MCYQHKCFGVQWLRLYWCIEAYQTTAPALHFRIVITTTPYAFRLVSEHKSFSY
nr:MAG TPA: hypothetical protein [Caudoviricetes sp.]